MNTLIFIDKLINLKIPDVGILSYLTVTTSLVFTTTLLASYFVFNTYRNQYKNKYSVTPKWPPGPKPWPIIGNILQLKPNKGQQISEKFQEIADEHGEIIHIYVGMGIDLIFLTGTNLIREAYVNHSDVFSNRPIHVKPLLNNKGERGIIMRNGEDWKNIRRFALKTLRDFGVGKLLLERAIQEEAAQVVEVLLRKENEAIDLKFTINKSVSNIICTLLFGERYDHDDKEFIDILKTLDLIISNGGSQTIVKLFLPMWLLRIVSNQEKRSHNALQKIYIYIRSKIAKHREDFDAKNLRDFTDHYLKSQIENGGIDEDDIFHLIIDLFMAGTETTTTTLRWMVLFMIRLPDIQDRCRKEIHEVIGESRIPCMKDVGSLPYTEAMIMELQRHSNLLPIGLFHCTSRPIEFKGYLIPENTFIMVNNREAMFNEVDYPNPHEFLPERWLNSDQTALKTEIPKSYMPFGIGPRICAAENLAKTELFIFTVYYLQHIKFDLEDPDVLPPKIGIEKATNAPQSYKVRISSCVS